MNVHGHDLLYGELAAAIVSEQADGVSAALAAMPHMFI
ncbi:hypothetical protein ACVWWG_001903 [Bradyrhizobium sp. LB7.2]